MSETLENRFEIIFLYDVQEGNPNGDPVDENRPRIDKKTGENIVTDVRLKRTIRDYLMTTDQNVFVKEVRHDENDNLLSKTEMVEKAIDGGIDDMKQSEAREALFEQFIDLRLFGATIAHDDIDISQTGPVQFKMGRSMHSVDRRYIAGSTVLASGEGKGTGTLTDRYDLPYSLIAFYGVVNENSASDTHLTRKDVENLFEGMWNGTKNLITGSKMEHKPQALIVVEHQKGSNHHIGGLDRELDYDSDLDDEELREIDDLELDLNELNKKLEKSDTVERVHYKSDINVEEKLTDQVEKSKLEFN